MKSESTFSWTCVFSLWFWFLLCWVSVDYACRHSCRHSCIQSHTHYTVVYCFSIWRAQARGVHLFIFSIAELPSFACQEYETRCSHQCKWESVRTWACLQSWDPPSQQPSCMCEGDATCTPPPPPIKLEVDLVLSRQLVQNAACLPVCLCFWLFPADQWRSIWCLFTPQVFRLVFFLFLHVGLQLFEFLYCKHTTGTSGLMFGLWGFFVPMNRSWRWHSVHVILTITLRWSAIPV